MAESSQEFAVIEQAQRVPLPQARLNPNVPRPLGEYVGREINSAYITVEKSKNPKNVHRLEAEARTATRFITFSRIHEQLSQPQPAYQELATVLQAEVEQHTADITRYQTEMRGKLPGDDRFMTLEAKRLTASTIRAKLTDQGEQAFMDTLRQEWKDEQLSTDRGKILTSIAQTHEARAHVQQLQQLLPKSPAEPTQ